MTELGRWIDGELPAGVVLGSGTQIIGHEAFKRYFPSRDGALTIGRDATMDQTKFSVGIDGTLAIGDLCLFENVVLMCEASITVGSRVVIGWNCTIMDCDYHPLEPARRLADVFACSQIGAGMGLERPSVEPHPVVIDDDVWIGPACTVMKGVTIGAGSFVEPGSVVTTDVPPRSRVVGSPARVVSRV